ncbi:Shedu anti-phage system protein SduA domain-containing protein [Limosilactobacillus agrestimuris]|uniref:Shedu anti-phage system protein SduA domain-containing protein n=1 Tax=Limosilactobacillus agrestimuris TaxID=2941331 RepID=UPI00203E083B|nr:Shedu anti-phage system protein SduA domain-containing protein [Limosilactobacillus agrestimuris]
MKIIKTPHYKFSLIRKRLLDIDQDVLFVSKKSEDNFSFKRELFCTGYQKSTSVLKKASNLISGKFIVILSDDLLNEFQGKQGTISFADYKKLLDTFPTTRVLEHYGDKIIADNLTNFILKKNYSELFIKSKNMVMEKHKENLIKIGNNSLNYNIATNLDKSFKILKKEIETESSIQDESYWQKIILNILPVIYPQYIGFIREFVIPENISKENKTTKRRIDHALIDVNGNVDLLEVKCPFPKNHLIMKSKYRDNYIAARELEGGIFQLEKYIYYIDHLGLKEGNKISEKIKSKIRNKENYKISQNFHLKFSNPKGILLIGHCKFTELERIDFDIIRKQYNNIMDIITYDDLLDRLERLLAFYKS